jgi:hypothetical protein
MPSDTSQTGALWPMQTHAPMLDNTVSPCLDRTRSSGSFFVEKSEWPLIRRWAEEKA